MKKTTSPWTLFVCLFVLEMQAVELSDSAVIQLSDIEVQANRRKQFSEIGTVVKTVEVGEIDRMPVQQLDGLLKNISGVDVRQRGIGGTQADLSLRGGSFDQVLVLLNGMNITDTQTGHHNLDIPVDLSQVSKVEVLQGGAARRYGNQAFSGVLNVVTDPHAKSLIDVAFSAGSYKTRTHKLSVGLGKGAWKHFSSIAFGSSEGYRSNTDYETMNIFSQTNVSLHKMGTFDIQLALQQKSFGANGFYSLAYPNQFEHTQTVLAALGWHTNFKKWMLDVKTFHRRHYDRFELFRDFTDAPVWYQDHNYHLTSVSEVSVDVKYTGVFGNVSGGVSFRNDHIYSTVLGHDIAEELEPVENQYEKKQVKYFNKAAGRFLQTGYVDYAKNIKQFYFSAGASVSNSRDFGLQHHVGADISYYILNDFALFMAANTSSRLPTFTDLYYQSPTQDANPDLLPEQAITTEWGLNLKRKAFRLKGVLFYRVGNNIIDWIRYPEQEKWISTNLTTLHTTGTDISLSYASDDSFFRYVKLSYAFIYTDKATSDFDSKYALDYLQHHVVFQTNHKLTKKTNVNWNFAYYDRAGEYTEFTTGNPKSYDPFLLLSTRVSWQEKKIILYADFHNIFNQTYVDFGGLPMPGIHAEAGIRWKFK